VRRRLLVVWLVLAVLAGTIAAIEYSDRGRPDESAGEHIAGAPGSRMLLPAPVEELSAIEVGHSGTLHRFERDASGAWFYHGIHSGAEGTHGHQTDPAVAQRIETAFTGFGRTRMERSFALDLQAGDYGVTSPDMIVLVYHKGSAQPLAQYAVGDIAPDGLSRYVLRVGGSTVVTIANYQIDNLLALIEAVSGKSAPGKMTGKRP
jgi:hypothetical protein